MERNEFHKNAADMIYLRYISNNAAGKASGGIVVYFNKAISVDDLLRDTYNQLFVKRGLTKLKNPFSTKPLGGLCAVLT